MTTSTPTAQLPPCEYSPPPYRGPSKDEIMADRGRYCHPAIFTYYREPLLIVDGHMQYLFDETGRRYLDLLGGIATVSCGHCHPKITERVKAQIDRLQHASTIYAHPNFPELGKKLAARMPPGLDVTYFTNSGSEANELAVAMARLYTGNEDIIALRNGYHGGTATPMGLTSHSTWKYPLPSVGKIHHAACPDPYRSPFEGTPEEIARQSAEDIRELVKFTTSGRIAGFIAEPIQGVGGVTHGATNYLGLAFDIVREHGGLCIADEVQTGFGRTGESYWGFQNHGVVPDIVTMAKGIGNGFPLAAVTTRADIAQAMTGKIHFNTFGGNPVSMAAGSAVLDVIEEEGLQENARRVGALLGEGFEQLQQRHPLIGDVRGLGLMRGVEFVRNRETLEPATQETAELLEATREMGVLFGKGGFYGNVLRVKPPMCMTSDDAAVAVAALGAALDSI